MIAFANQLTPAQPALTPQAPAFVPAPQQVEAIITAMVAPDLTLAEIAAMNHITIDTLATFLARPEMRERMDALEAALAERTRRAAEQCLASAAAALKKAM